VDINGDIGTEAASINVPIVGNAAYNAFVTGAGKDTYTYVGCSLNSIVNGIEGVEGGAITPI
jgi:hypothetical protein